ncbi:MAG: outer membrane protein assembly factor BamA [Oxalobacteraceae bacterium]|jgi:outer membrane protein insertion porin family|nr:outer membrane protein assembly factor BamA [Oxalobacteraceae bacterium]
MKPDPARLTLPFIPKLIAAAVFALCAGQSAAVEPFTVKDIRVEGIQRTEAGTVFSYLPVRVGDTFNDEKAAAAIKALYATGFFKDVRVEADGNVLVIMVEERPAIASVDFTGTKEFDKVQLTKSLKDLGLGESRILDKSLVDRAEQELKRQYLSRGLYGVQITTTITPLERNRVGVTFAVDEGEVARIKKINIIGNKVFSDSELQDQIKLSTPGWFTWYSKSDQYSKQKLAGDIEALRSFYLNRGYLEMQVESTQVAISPDKKDIYITINIIEGQKFSVADIKLDGELLGREKELESLVTLKKGDAYSGEKMNETTRKISERMGVFGYAFANVNASPDINREKSEVTFTIFVDPGKRVYVRRINIGGNDRTRDEVIRREFRQFESSWYEGDKIRLSRDRLGRLGFFLDTNVDTVEVPGAPDQVDLNVNVSEKPTGNVMIGAGFSSSEKLTLTGSINQANAFGTGNNIGISVNTSRVYRTIALQHTNPYFTEDGVSKTTEIFLRTSRPPLYLTDINYRVVTRGGNVSFGVPFTEFDRVFLGAGIEDTTVNTYENSPSRYREFVHNANNDPGSFDPLSATDGVGNARTMAFPLTAAWQRDNRDSALIPTKGRFRRANVEVSPAGSSTYYRTTYQDQYFIPLNLSNTATLAFNGEINYGGALGDNAYPIFKNYFAGGIGTVRGYQAGSLSVSQRTRGLGDTRFNLPIGGSARIILNAELQMPFPGTGVDRSLRWFTFLDAGQVFSPEDGERIGLNQLRYSTGLGLSWISPVGPLKLSLGYPMNPQPFDRTQRFQFQLGTGF